MGTQQSENNHPSVSRLAQARATFMWVGLGYLVFVIYGSLVPLAFHARSWTDALQAFRAIEFLDLPIASRADWVANILLFIPLAFLWCGVLWPSRNDARRALVMVGVFLACVGLSVAIEFSQLFFPPRSVTLNDIFAESVGALLGLAVWWGWGARAQIWLAGWSGDRTPLDRWGQLLYLYLFVLFSYNLLPLDLTLSPVEIFHKWREGRVIVIPFSFIFANPIEALYGLLTDVLVWVPVAFLWAFRHPIGRMHPWMVVVLLATLLEFLQLFVYTRVSDTTDIFTAGIGAAIGIWINRRWLGQSHLLETSKVVVCQHPALWFGLAIFWSWVLVAVFWYPFQFQFESSFLEARWPALFKVPFEAYYWGSEYRAATEVLHKVGFFMPLGVLLALWSACIKSYAVRRLAAVGAFVAIVLIPLGIEIGQFFLPEKNADLTDWMLEVLGGLAGYGLARYLGARQIGSIRSHVPTLPETTTVQATSTSTVPYGGRRALTNLSISASIVALAAWGVTHSPWVPYNVRELLDPTMPVLSIALLTCALYWVIGFPVWVMRSLARGEIFLLAFPLHILVHGLFTWGLIRLAVPLESIHDIVGTPVLGWLWEWEMLGRFLALFSIWSVAATSGVILATWGRLPSMRIAMAGWVIGAAVWIPIAYYIVVVQAATDNLTELMANNASVGAFSWLVLWLVGVVFAGVRSAWLLIPGEEKNVRAVVGIVTSIVLSYFAFQWGTEQAIIKYDQVFSAAQFLLSADREHLASSGALIARYIALYSVLIVLISTIVSPLLRCIQTPQGGKLTRHMVDH